MDYKGYKLLDKIILVCREEASRDDSCGANGGNNYYQAYLVDPANNKQRESARQWARWIEYAPWVKDENDNWVREDYEINHEPVEFEFENNGFTLELLDCAGGSSQGGKLSFWNCLVKKDDKTFKIGINSDMLLDLLKNATFDKGICQSQLIFITQNGKVGMTAEGSETYKQCVADRELKNTLKASQVSKFEFGDILKTTTLEEVYLGTMTKYYHFDIGRNSSRYTVDYDLRDCTITKLAKPIKYHMFDSVPQNAKLSGLAAYYKGSKYAYPDAKKSCPKRTIDGKLELDITQEELYNKLVDKTYDFDAYLDYYLKSHNFGRTRLTMEDYALYYFLCSRGFGFGTEPFELPEALMEKIKAAGIKYVDETLKEN